MSVWVVVGWFGSEEWIERIFATQERAEEFVNELWVERRSPFLPDDDYRQGVCKFAAWKYNVVE